MTQQGSRVGQRLGNYQLERLLGQGGFAEVYLGHHLRLQRQAAIKVLYAHLSAQEVEAFQREAQVIAGLDHPNIVRILDFDVQQGVPFLVMDYLPNGTLRQRHSKGERVPLPTIVAYVKQLADALQYAHDQRLIHRDVKPENMLIGRRNELVLSDFGIAAVAHSTSSMTAQTFAGTLPYMAPEQIQSQPRPASDQYTLGVVVYEWLSGRRPFDGSSTEIFAKHLMMPPPPLRQKLPDLSSEVEQVIFTALAKEPGQRFGSMLAFATALEQASQAPQPAAEVPADAIEKTVMAQSPQPLPPSSQPPPVLLSFTTSVSTTLSTSAPNDPLPATAVLTSVDTPPQKRVPERKVSRRAVVIGLAALEVLALCGGVAWVVVGSRNSSTTSYTPPFIYRGHSDKVNTVAWSSDGARITSGGDDHTVQVWDVADKGKVLTYKGHVDIVRSAAWSHDSTYIASGGDDQSVQVWNAFDESKVFFYQGHSNLVYAVTWSRDGTRIASGSSDNTVQVWNATDGGKVFTYKGHSDVVSTVAWSPDGKRIASGSLDNTVQVWNAVNGKNALTYKGHARWVLSVTWSPDGKRIASGGLDNTVQVWNVTDGRKVFTYKGHSDTVSAVAWSPDGSRIASGSWDHTIQVWNAADGADIFTYKGHSGVVNAVTWSPDGTRIVSGSDDHTVQVWSPQ